jgi:hypothetical protein
MYEPRTFVLEDDDGTIVEGFTPDFYLPEADVYLECATAKQSLTTRKNGRSGGGSSCVKRPSPAHYRPKVPSGCTSP